MLTVMSYNVESFTNDAEDRVDYDSFAEAIRASGADIIGLNETYDKGTLFDETQVKAVAEKLGYYWYFAKAAVIDDGNDFGNSILSRFPIEGAESIPIPDPDPKTGSGYYETRCILRAKICGKTVLVTHFGLNADEEENAVQTVLQVLEDKNCILMGDLNVRPDNPVLLPIRDRMFDSAAVSVDALLSFPAIQPDRKIDYIFVSKDITVQSVEIPPVVISDHRPIRAILA